MFRLSFLISLFVLSQRFCFAQKQGNVWCMGSGAGLDFNFSPPVVSNTNQIYSQEGCATICDSSGALLFYTNGVQIWNRNHQVMPHGDTLLGHWSSTQAAIILPKPGSTTLYYVFTTDAFYINNLQYGFRYTAVDMCMENGNGDAVPLQKNILLLDTVAEKLTAIRHANGIDYWVVIHKFNSDAFYAYQFSAAGVSSPVVSAIGSYHGNNVAQSIGMMKLSPDGSKLGVVNGNAGPAFFVEYFDFNTSTGQVSNRVDLKPAFGPNDQFYGVTFSPDNTKMYVTCWLNGNGVFQFDLNRGGGHPDSVRASKTLVSPVYGYGGMQLGPDGKIYVTKGFSGYQLSVIHAPDLPGTFCNFDDVGIYFNGVQGGMTPPNYVDSYDYPNTSILCYCTAQFAAPGNVCPGTCIDFTNFSVNATAYQWFFQGGTPSSSTDPNPASICYATPGSYDVTLIATNGNLTDILTLPGYITVFPNSPISIQQSGDTLLTTFGFLSYQWFFNGDTLNGATGYMYLATQNGNYSVIGVDSNGCYSEAVAINVIAEVTDAAGNIGIHVYPNPAGDELIFAGLHSSVTLRIFDHSGNLVRQIDVTGKTVNGRGRIKIDTLAPGLYILEMLSVGNLIRHRFLKQ